MPAINFGFLLPEVWWALPLLSFCSGVKLFLGTPLDSSLERLLAKLVGFDLCACVCFYTTVFCLAVKLNEICAKWNFSHFMYTALGSIG